MIVVVESGGARLDHAHDYTEIEVLVPDSLPPHDVGEALSGAALGGVTGALLHLDVPGLARTLRAHNAYAARWFEAAVGCASLRGWVRDGDRLSREIGAVGS